VGEKPPHQILPKKGFYKPISFGIFKEKKEDLQIFWEKLGGGGICE